MCANTQQNLNPIESSIWQLYNQQKSKELQLISPGMPENEQQMIAWFEFLQIKWSLNGATEENSISRFDDALRLYEFGPDLRSGNRLLLNLSKTIKIKKPKNHTIKSHLKGARDDNKPKRAHNSSYTYYIHKRSKELQNEGVAFCVKSTVRELAQEWNSLSDEQRMAIDKEWSQYCQSVDNEENINNDRKNDNENEISSGN